MPKPDNKTDITFLGATPYERLKTLMNRLRTECPWDSQQSFDTIAPYTIEEAYEVSDAIEHKDMNALKEELGDLLFQVLFHSIMAAEIDAFDLDDVCDSLTRKMVERHPYIFKYHASENTNEQTISWENIKAKERQNKGYQSLLDDVALALPALMRAEKLQKRAASVGFDWPDLSGVFAKIDEETHEVIQALTMNDQDALEDEIGDLIFAVTNLARKTSIDPEKALRRTNQKFYDRFRYIEKVAQANGQKVEELSLDEMEALWQAAKSHNLRKNYS